MAGNGAFPEYPLWSHYKRSHDWTPDGLDRLLDAGCAWGYGTRHFHTKARTVFGLDPGAAAIAVAQQRYPSSSFVEGVLESTPFESKSEEYGGRLVAWAKRFLSWRSADMPASTGMANTNRYYRIPYGPLANNMTIQFSKGY